MRLLPLLLLLAAVAAGGLYAVEYTGIQLGFRLVVDPFAPQYPVLIVYNLGATPVCIESIRGTIHLDRVEYAAVSINETICLEPGENATILLGPYERLLWSPARLLDLLRSLYSEAQDLKILVRFTGGARVRPNLPGALPVAVSFDASALVDYRALVKPLEEAVERIKERATSMTEEGRHIAHGFEERASKAIEDARDELQKTLREIRERLGVAKAWAVNASSAFNREARRAAEAARSIIAQTHSYAEQASRVIAQGLQGLRERLNHAIPAVNTSLPGIEELRNTLNQTLKGLKERLNSLENLVNESLEELRESLEKLEKRVSESLEELVLTLNATRDEG